MEDQNNSKDKSSESTENSNNQGILNYKDDDKQSLFKVFGIELTAPAGLKNPRIVYLSFILVNVILLLFLKNLISN